MRKLYILSLVTILFIITGCSCVKNNDDPNETKKKIADNYVTGINDQLSKQTKRV